MSTPFAESVVEDATPATSATALGQRVREPHVKHLEGRLWEIRISGQGGIARAVYVTAMLAQLSDNDTQAERTDRRDY